MMVAVTDHDLAPFLCGQVEEVSRFPGEERHRLFDEDMAAGLQAFAGDGMVRGVRSDHDDAGQFLLR